MITPIPYESARLLIHDGDLLLFRRRGLISIAGRGLYSHAAMAAWWGKELFCLEVREWFGGRAVLLSSQVRRCPGRIGVYRPRVEKWPEFQVDNAVAYMKRLCGSRYGYRNVAAAAMLHLPVVRLFVKPNTDDESVSKFPPFCSEAIAAACQKGGGVDPVPGLANRLTEPNDLSRSTFFCFTKMTIGKIEEVAT